MYIILLLFCTAVLGLPDQSQSCISNKNIPFTGYKVEYQLNVQKWNGSYHLLYCNDNKLIYDMDLNDTIPWTKTIDYYNKVTDVENDTQVVVLARRKSFALRKLPLYLPNTLVGSLFYGPEIKQIHLLNSTSQIKSIPLMASNILNNWLEMNYKLQFIYHVPILTTPGIDSRRFSYGFFESGRKENNWDQFISMSESYTFNYDSRILIRQASDNALNFLNRIIDSNKLVQLKLKESFTKQKSSKIFWKLILLSKMLEKELFEDIIVRIDKFLKY